MKEDLTPISPWVEHPFIEGIKAQRLRDTVKVFFEFKNDSSFKTFVLSDVWAIPLFNVPKEKWILFEQFIYLRDGMTSGEMIFQKRED